MHRDFNRNGPSVPRFCEQCGATLNDRVNEYSALCLACAPREKRRRESDDEDVGTPADFRDEWIRYSTGEE